jgi:hypothetical protein
MKEKEKNIMERRKRTERKGGRTKAGGADTCSTGSLFHPTLMGSFVPGGSRSIPVSYPVLKGVEHQYK